LGIAYSIAVCPVAPITAAADGSGALTAFVTRARRVSLAIAGAVVHGALPGRRVAHIQEPLLAFELAACGSAEEALEIGGIETILSLMKTVGHRADKRFAQSRSLTERNSSQFGRDSFAQWA
jgi:hypothetical protein